MNHEQDRVAQNGIHFTPRAIAKVLVERAIPKNKKKPLDFLDPACGHGALLESAIEFCGENYPSSVAEACTFTGCDLFEPRDWLPGSRSLFLKTDFFNISESQLFDIILANPPYVPYGRVNPDMRGAYYDRISDHFDVPQNSDLWAYFILQALRHLKAGGTLAAILPWSFLEAHYAKPLRRILSRYFAAIDIRVLTAPVFDSTNTRVALVWLRNYGKSSKEIKIGFAERAEALNGAAPLPLRIWRSNTNLLTHGSSNGELYGKLDHLGFRELGDYADVRIGVVTGANNFFILPADQARKQGLPVADSEPIFKGVSDLEELSLDQPPNNVIPDFTVGSTATEAYLKEGAEQGIPERSHCQRRLARGLEWYEIDTGPPPDAMFTYRVSHTPFLALNPNDYQCTNSLHKLFFKSEVGQPEQRWIQISLLSCIGQLCLEQHGRHYGNGLLKIEPSSLKKVLTLAHEDPLPQNAYMKISEAISRGHRRKASKLADNLLKEVLGIDEDLLSSVYSALDNMRTRG